MAPKASKAAAPKKTAAAAASHGSYVDMIKDAILNLKERNGSSRQAIKKYVQANNSLGNTTDAAFNAHINRALITGETAGTFSRPKGPSGPVKLAKKGDAAPAKTTTKKPVAKKEKVEVEKKPAAAKKAAPAKKTAAKKAPAAKKAAAKPKANTGKKATKTAAAAPAVEDKPPVILGKTKSGRVTKTKAPAAASAPKKKAAPKKAAAAKKATPKKATPKKAES
ncbi:hypothetical protein NA57DRAFT_75570 [Rhizodiscina lignyota]|uniref:Histone H1 n=1 Tax=Rhizodiscina lignyota TaxID=1504668 RepID=A0A9P4IKZ0_9PEZI|nr:hypothetical protein NA57DRAFT_75570 [Rhizodiscina lignyota]